MKTHRLLLIGGLLAAGAAVAGGWSNVLFDFDGSIGVQPFRSAAGVPTLNTVAGVPPGGVPCGLTSFEATIKSDGDIRARGTGVLLLGADIIGTRGGPRQVILSLFCRNPPAPPAPIGSLQTTPFNSEPVDLDEDGETENMDAIKKFVGQQKLNYTIARSTDPAATTKAFHAITQKSVVPQSLLVDREGRLRGVFSGYGGNVISSMKESVDKVVTQQ